MLRCLYMIRLHVNEHLAALANTHRKTDADINKTHLKENSALFHKSMTILFLVKAFCPRFAIISRRGPGSRIYREVSRGYVVALFRMQTFVCLKCKVGTIPESFKHQIIWKCCLINIYIYIKQTKVSLEVRIISITNLV